MTENDSIPQGPPSGLTPILVVSNAHAASQFYAEAFGAQEIARIASPDGQRLLHCRMVLLGSVVVLMDEIPELAGPQSAFHPPDTLKGTTVTLHLQVDNALSTWSNALSAGAVTIIPLAKQFRGEIYGRLRDPFGHEWTIAQMIEQLDDQEVENAALATMKARGTNISA